MTKYLGWGQEFTYPMPDDAVGFLVQSATLANFNDTIVVLNSSYFDRATIWVHDEVRITQLWVNYNAAAAGTVCKAFVCTGYDPITYILFPAGTITTTAAGETIVSTDIDIPLHAPTSAVNAFLFVITGFAATDDITVGFRGWYRDKQPSTLYPARAMPVAVESVRIWPKRPSKEPI